MNYHKEYYLKNKDKAKENYLKNKEKKLEYQKQYNKKNKERIREYWKKYYLFFKDEYSQYNKTHYRINSNKIKFNRRLEFYKKMYGINSNIHNSSFEREDKIITISFD